MATKLGRCFAALAVGGGTFRVPLRQTHARTLFLRRPEAKPFFTGRRSSRPALAVCRVWPAGCRGRSRCYVAQAQAQGDVPVTAKLAEEVSSQSAPVQEAENVVVPEIRDQEIDASRFGGEFSEVQEAEFEDVEGDSDVRAEGADDGEEEEAEDGEKKPEEAPKISIKLPHIPVPEARDAFMALINAKWTDMDLETKSKVMSALGTRNGTLLDCWDAYHDVLKYYESFQKLTKALDEARVSNTLPPELLNDVVTAFMKYNKLLSDYEEDGQEYLRQKTAGELGASMKTLQEAMDNFTKASRKSSKKGDSSDPYGYNMNDMFDEYYDNYYKENYMNSYNNNNPTPKKSPRRKKKSA